MNKDLLKLYKQETKTTQYVSKSSRKNNQQKTRISNSAEYAKNSTEFCRTRLNFAEIKEHRKLTSFVTPIGLLLGESSYSNPLTPTNETDYTPIAIGQEQYLIRD